VSLHTTEVPFSFTLLRQRSVGASGAMLDEELPDPSVWAECDAADARQSNWLALGRGQLVATEADALEFARSCLDSNAEGAFIKARLTMELPHESEPRMGDLLAVHLSDSEAIVYELALLTDTATLDPAADVSIDLEPGVALLQQRLDFGLLDTAGALDHA
jgi:hypothetical protein